MTTGTTELTGRMLIAGTPVFGDGEQIRAVDPGTGAELEPAYGWGGQAEVERACAAAEALRPMLRELAAQLGAARDWDVFLEGLGARLAERDAGDTARLLAAARVQSPTASMT